MNTHNMQGHTLGDILGRPAKQGYHQRRAESRLSKDAVLAPLGAGFQVNKDEFKRLVAIAIKKGWMRYPLNATLPQ